MPKKKHTPLFYRQPTNLDWPWCVGFTETKPQRWYLMRQPDPAASPTQNLLPLEVLQLAPHASGEDAEAEAAMWVHGITEQIAHMTAALRTWSIEPVGVDWQTRRLSAVTSLLAPGALVVRYRRFTFLVGVAHLATLLRYDDSNDTIAMIQRGRIVHSQTWQGSEDYEHQESPQDVMDTLINWYRLVTEGPGDDADES